MFMSSYESLLIWGTTLHVKHRFPHYFHEALSILWINCCKAMQEALRAINTGWIL